MTQKNNQSTDPTATKHRGGLLDLIEWVGNKLPDPATLFVIGTILVMILSHIAVKGDWSVEKQLPQRVESTDGGEAQIEWVPTGEVLRAKSLFTRDGVFAAIKDMVDNFRLFPPLGVVLVGMLGIGVAERTGLLGALLKAVMLVVPNWLLTPTMVFVGIMSSMTLDAGYVVLPPLAAALYRSVGRSPMVGIAAVFAGVSAGFNANLFITGLEPLLAGFADTGAKIIDPSYRVNPACNWYFMAASTVVMTVVGWFVTAWFVEHRFEGKPADEGGPTHPSEEELKEQQLKPAEIRGLGWSALVFAVTFGGILAMILVPKAPLFTYHIPSADNIMTSEVGEIWYPVVDNKTIREYNVLGHELVMYNDATRQTRVIELPSDYKLENNTIVTGNGSGSGASPPESIELTKYHFIRGLRVEFTSPTDGSRVVVDAPVDNVIRDGLVIVPSTEHFDRWVDSIVPILFLCFIIPAIVYGIIMGGIRNDKDVAKLLMESMAGMAPIIVLAFFAGQFIAYFGYSGLDRMLALAGGQALGKSGLSPYMLIIAFIGVTMIFNLFVGSMSAKYAMFAPIFIPMFMMIGISPELTQAAYRIGDSVTNIITPLNAYLVIILVFMQKYVPKGGMGTLISTMVPYTIVFAIVWTLMLLVWMWFGWDLGPDGGLKYDVTAIVSSVGG